VPVYVQMVLHPAAELSHRRVLRIRFRRSRGEGALSMESVYSTLAVYTLCLSNI
jgi:hypothetical protein